MWRTEQALPVLVVAGVAWGIVTSTETLFVKGISTAVIVIAFVVAGFRQRIVQRLPTVVRGFLMGAQRLVTHPVVSMLILLGLLAAAYDTGQRPYLIALFVAIVLLVPPKLRWRVLLRRPAGTARLPTQDLLAELETLEGSPRAGPDGPNVIQLPWQGTSRNTFVLVRGPALRDSRVEFDAILRPNAVLNVVVRYDPAANSGYMLRLDSRTTSSEYDAILIMKNGVWGDPIQLSRRRTPTDEWVHVLAAAHGHELQLFRDSVLVCAVDDGAFNAGKVGFFSELADAAIRDLTVTGA